jgi:glycosyltransferase 2 family protein
MKMPRPLAASLKYLVTLLLLFLVFRSVDISKISNDVKSIDSKSLIILVALCWAGQLLCSERWRIFASALRMHGKYRSFFQVYFAGMFFNIGLPSLVGGDIVKAYVISRKSSQPLLTGLASVLQDRGAGLIALLVYGSLAILLHPISWRGFPLSSVYLLSWVAIALFLALVFKGGRLYSRFLDPQNRALLQKALRRMADFHQALGKSSLTRSQAIRVTLYSIFYAGLVLWIFQQVTVAAGHRVGVVPFSALFPLITLGTMLPVTFGGLGIREWLYVEALSLVGVPRDHGLVISLATSALYLAVNLGGILFLPTIPFELRPQAFEFQENAAQPNKAEDRIPQQNDVI